MRSFLDLARRRRSVRKYRSDPVGDEVLARILDAGRIAPSGNNSQPWRFIVVRDAEMKRRLHDVAGRQPWILEAPVTVAIVGDIAAKMKEPPVGETPSIDDPAHKTVLIKTVRDATIAADHIVLAATDEGLGSCWIALFEQEEIRPVLCVPESCYVVAIVTLGYAAETPPARARHALREIVFEERWGRRGERPAFGCERE